MSGFSADWLDLREGADHRARNSDVAAALADALRGRAEIRVVDLGCGLGSNLRGLFRTLPARQSWRLVDHDPALLAGARARLAAWADTAHEEGAALVIEKDGRRLDVRFTEADLVQDLDGSLDDQGVPPDLVTAAALFDLCGDAWIARFAAAVVARRALFHTVLSYDGRETWSPPHPADAEIRAAFLAHQGEDKGLGVAAGPAATQRLAEAFSAAGWVVVTGESPWRLEARLDAALLRALAGGQAGAVAETGRLAPEVVESWRAARAQAQAASIGHLDILCRPG